MAVMEGEGQERFAHPRIQWGRQMAFINPFYFCLWDPEWGAALWKTNAYAPYPIWIWLNGHTWALRKCIKAGTGFTALDNGFHTCADPAKLQRNRLGSGAVHRLFWRSCRQLPSPFTDADRRAGYGTSWRFGSSKSATPACSTGQPPGGCFSRR